MTTPFGVAKFRSLLVAGTFTVLASFIVRLSDSIIAGNFLGADALAGVNLAGPFLSAVSFIGGLIATGSATRYSIAMGRCDQTRARQFFMQGGWSALLLGGVLAAGMFCGRDSFLAFIGAEGACLGFARDYLGWACFLAVVEPLEVLLVALGYADGDSRLCMASYLTVFLANFLFSTVAVTLGYGTAGCALGSVVADSLGILVMGAHFFRKSNTFRPVAHFSLRDSCSIFGASFGDSAAFLCDGLLFLFLNKLAVMAFGSGVLPVVGVVTSVWGLMAVFDGVGVAIQPIVTVYFGERNHRAIRTVMQAAMKVSLLEGLAAMLLLLLWPSGAALMVGIDDPTLRSLSDVAIRWVSIGFVARAFAGLFNSYYMFVERSLLAGMVTFITYLAMPVAAIAAGVFLGMNGLWIGMGAGTALGLAMVAAVQFTVAHAGEFPLYLDSAREAKQQVFNLPLEERAIVEVSRAVGEVPGVPMRAALLVEEVLMAVRDRAAGRRLLGEVSLDLNDGVMLTLRDDGEIFDITDADQRIVSLRSFLVASMMQYHDGKTYLVTTGFNRNVFRF